jgi:hypothetical protein
MEVSHLKFLGLIIDDRLSWNLHIDNIVKRLTSVCYMIRAVKPYMSFSSLKMIYSSLFHSVLSYNIVFWRLSSSSNKLFKLQKRVVRIITGQGNRTSCMDLFKKLEILPLKSQYIFSILLFVVNNKDLFISNYDSDNVRTRQSIILHFPPSLLTLYQNGTYFAGIKIFNGLPSHIKKACRVSQNI